MRKNRLITLLTLCSAFSLISCSPATPESASNPGESSGVSETSKGETASIPDIPETEGLTYELNRDGSGYMVSGEELNSLTQIHIPSTHEGLPVTEIDDLGFEECGALELVIIPDSIEKIGARPFSYCHSLTNIYVEPANENYYSSGNCVIEKHTRTLIIGCANSVIPNDIYSIGPSAFAYNYSLKTIEIPDGIALIEEGAFRECINLTSVTIPNTVTSIYDYAFYLCSNLTSVSIPASVTSIGSRSFGYCGAIESISVDSANTTFYSENNCLIDRVNNMVVLGCKNSVIPSGITYIGWYSFFGCNQLTSVTIPSSVTYIGLGAFSGCDSLTSAIFENPNGWLYGDETLASADLSDPSIAANFLTIKYISNVWLCS